MFVFSIGDEARVISVVGLDIPIRIVGKWIPSIEEHCAGPHKRYEVQLESGQIRTVSEGELVPMDDKTDYSRG